jgi:hypothetical protein
MKALLSLALLVGSLNAYAFIDQTRMAIKSPKDTVALSVLRKGTLEATASSGVGLSASQNSSLGFTVGAQYFLDDKIAVGGTAAMISNPEVGFLAIEPKASYYFYKKGRTAAFVSESIDMGPLFSSGTPVSFGDYMSLNTSVGGDYFITNNVAVSPSATLGFGVVGTTSGLVSFNGGLDFKLFFQ